MDNLKKTNGINSDEILNIHIVPDYQNQTSSTGLVYPVKDDDFIAKFQLSFKRNLWILALVASFLLSASCFIPYLISVNEGLVHPILPYVSDAGGSHPAAGFFSFMFTISMFSISIFVWVRYKIIDYYLNGLLANSSNKLAGIELIERLSKINFYSLFPAYMTIFGGIIVTSFRSTEYFQIHVIGACLSVSMGFYCFMQIYLCYKLNRIGQIESKPISMMIVYVLAILSIVVCAVFTILSYFYRDLRYEWTDQTRLLWSPEMDGYHLHILATFSEWIAILCAPLLLICLSNRVRSFKYWEQISF